MKQALVIVVAEVVQEVRVQVSTRLYQV